MRPADPRPRLAGQDTTARLVIYGVLLLSGPLLAGCRSYDGADRQRDGSCARDAASETVASLRGKGADHLARMGGFQVLFSRACMADGEGYVATIEELVAAAQSDPTITAELRREGSSDDWRRSLTAKILLLRVERPEEYRRAAENLNGTYPKTDAMRAHIRNDQYPWRIAAARSHLGDDLIYLALENLFKARTCTRDSYLSWSANFATVSSARDPRWNELLLSAVLDESFGDAARGETADFLLNNMKDLRGAPYLTEALEARPLNPTRASHAMGALSAAGYAAAVPKIEAIALDRTENTSVRVDAMEALISMRAERAQKVLLHVFATAGRDSLILNEIASGLGAIGDARAVPVLKQVVLRLSGEDAAVARDGLAELKARLAKPH